MDTQSKDLCVHLLRLPWLMAPCTHHVTCVTRGASAITAPSRMTDFEVSTSPHDPLWLVSSLGFIPGAETQCLVSLISNELLLQLQQNTWSWFPTVEGQASMSHSHLPTKNVGGFACPFLIAQ